MLGRKKDGGGEGLFQKKVRQLDVLKAHEQGCRLHQLYASSRASARQATVYLEYHLPQEGFSAADIDVLLHQVLHPSLTSILQGSGSS